MKLAPHRSPFLFIVVKICALLSLILTFQNCSPGYESLNSDLNLSSLSVDVPEFLNSSLSHPEYQPEPEEEGVSRLPAAAPAAEFIEPSSSYVAGVLSQIDRRISGQIVELKNKTSTPYWSMADSLRIAYDLYKDTEDPSILFFLLKTGEELIGTTSEKLNIKDVLLKKTIPAWVTGNYSCAKPYAHLVHNMILIDNIAYAADTLIRSKQIKLTDSDLKRIQKLALYFERTFAVFDSDFVVNRKAYRFSPRESSLSSCAANKFATRAGTDLPMNMNTAAGLAHFRMYRLWTALGDTKKRDFHKDRFSKIASYFKSALSDFKSGQHSGYTWNYVKDGRIEDTSHAYISIRFVESLKEYDWSFSDTHMQKLAATFHILYKDNKSARSHLSLSYGKIGTDPGYLTALAKFIVLCPYDPKIYGRAKTLITAGHGGQHGEILLRRYKNKCK